MTNNKKLSRQEMIDAIYEKIADKTLSFGCGFLCKYGLDKNYIKRIILGDLGKEFLTIYPDYPFPITQNHKLFDRVRKDCVLKIIGHPVMIGDVIDFIYNKLPVIISPKKTMNIVNRDGKKINITELLYFWKEKRKPIEEQLDKCVEFVFNLIK